MKHLFRTFLLALFAAGAVGLLAGCASDEAGPSPLPWSQTPGWYGPLPSTINQGR
jgi:hypothetical protein